MRPTKEFYHFIATMVNAKYFNYSNSLCYKGGKGAIEEVITLYYKGIDCLGYDGT